MTQRTVILIPALNAERTLSTLLDALLVNTVREDILVINDGSTDSTEAIARSRQVACISEDRNRGKGSALSSGFRALREDKTIDSVITMDADLQHDTRDIQSFVKCRAETRSNLILGRRRIVGTHMPLARRLSNILTSLLVSARTGVRIRDSQCGFRLIGREVLEKVEIESQGFEAETELLLKACKAGFMVASVPVRTVYNGEPSHMTHWNTTRRFIQTLMKEL